MKTNALEIRQRFGKILKKLKATGEPVIIEKGRQPVAVLISLEAFHQRFIDCQEAKKQQELLERIRGGAKTPSVDSLKVLRELRYGSGH